MSVLREGDPIGSGGDSVAAHEAVSPVAAPTVEPASPSRNPLVVWLAFRVVEGARRLRLVV